MAITDYLAQTFYGNTVQEWLVALLIILASFLVGKTLYWIFGKIVKAAAAKTTTKLDDLIVDIIEEPIVFIVVLTGSWFSIKTLTLSAGVATFIGQTFTVLVTFAVAWLLTKLLDAFIKEYLAPWTAKTESDLDDQLLPIVRKGVKIIIWVLAVILALNNAGYNVGALIAGLGIGGLAFAMAAKDTISNVFGGFTIFTDQPFKIGDRVKVAGYDGSIKEIGLRSTRLQTLEGRIVTIPNSKFSDSPVENVSLEPTRKVVLNLGLTYDTTPKQMEKAMELLKEISKKSKNIEEKVLISFNAFGDFSLGILFVYYIKKDADILGTQTEMNMEILKQFNKNKLDFAFPTQTLINKKG